MNAHPLVKIVLAAVAWFGFAVVGPQEPVVVPAPQPAAEVREPVDGQEPRDVAGDEVRAEVRRIRRLLLAGGRADVEAAAPAVRALGPRATTEVAREDWLRLARWCALRLGDREWLLQLRDQRDTVRTELGYAVMLARSEIEHANFAGAAATLARIGNIDGANEREKRRVYALRARLGQLDGDAAAERRNIEQIVDHLYLWPRPRCLECHAPSKQPDVVPGLPIRESWIGDRYVELLRQSGDAERVRADAEAALADDPADDDARVHLAFALRALGREEEADTRFRELPWAVFPDRDLPAPRQFATYP